MHTLYRKAADAAKRAHGIPHTIWHVTYDNGHQRHIMRERNEGPPVTGDKIKHILTTDGETSTYGEFPTEWPPPTKTRQERENPGTMMGLSYDDPFTVYMDGRIVGQAHGMKYDLSKMSNAERTAYYEHIRTMYDERDGKVSLKLKWDGLTKAVDKLKKPNPYTVRDFTTGRTPPSKTYHPTKAEAAALRDMLKAWGHHISDIVDLTSPKTYAEFWAVLLKYRADARPVQPRPKLKDIARRAKEAGY